MATSESGDDGRFAEPMRKKRRAAQAAEEKFQEYGRIFGRRGDEDEERRRRSMDVDFAPSSASGAIAEGSSSSGAIGASLPRRAVSHDDNDSGHDDEDEDDSDDDVDHFFESEAEEEESHVESTSEATKPPAGQKDKGTSLTAYHDFSPPPFLQKILAKRQREMDKIRRQLPVDSRSREEKLADWYKMLSRLDKPVALLSLISPQQHE